MKFLLLVYITEQNSHTLQTINSQFPCLSIMILCMLYFLMIFIETLSYLRFKSSNIYQIKSGSFWLVYCLLMYLDHYKKTDCCSFLDLNLLILIDPFISTWSFYNFNFFQFFFLQNLICILYRSLIFHFSLKNIISLFCKYHQIKNYFASSELLCFEI